MSWTLGAVATTAYRSGEEAGTGAAWRSLFHIRQDRRYRTYLGAEGSTVYRQNADFCAPDRWLASQTLQPYAARDLLMEILP